MVKTRSAGPRTVLLMITLIIITMPFQTSSSAKVDDNTCAKFDTASFGSTNIVKQNSIFLPDDKGNASVRPNFMVTWHDGRFRSYWIYVPSSYSDEKLTPLVIILHAGGESATSMISKTQFCKKAEESGFIAVFPNGISRVTSPFWRTWNAGYCCGISLIRNIDDIGFVDSLIDSINKWYNINQDRIYVTGHSNGAILTYWIGAELSNKIAAIAPVAGSIGGKIAPSAPLWIIPAPKYPVSVLVFHGWLDENVPYNGGDGNGSWGPSIDLSVNESVSFWVQQNGCDSTPVTETTETGNILIDTYRNGINDSEVVLYTIKNGGHGWPGSSIGDRPTDEISATNIIWTFFSSHAKNRL